MADLNLKKLSRADLLEMMIGFSEDAEKAKERERELREEFEREKMQLQHEMAEERAAMLKSFDEEKVEMRTKFNEQKAQMQAKFDRDIEGLKARLDREKQELVRQFDDEMAKIESSGSLAEASLKLGGIFEAGQKSVDLYVKTLQDQASREYEDFKKQMQDSQRRLALMERETRKRCEEMLTAAGGDGEKILEDISESIDDRQNVATDSSAETTEGQTPKEETAQEETISEETSQESPKAKETTENKDTDIAAQTEEPPVKRKRGRPRKVRIDE